MKNHSLSILVKLLLSNVFLMNVHAQFTVNENFCMLNRDYVFLRITGSKKRITHVI